MTFKTWLANVLTGKIGKAQDEVYDGFTAEMVETGQHLRIERDPLYPGNWHVKVSPTEEYRVQTDEWIENGRVDWAMCNCPIGEKAGNQVSHCEHVAAVLLVMAEEM